MINSTLGYDTFTKGHEYYGFNVLENNSVMYREWAPNAVTASLVGDFSEYILGGVNNILTQTLDNWDVNSHTMTRNKYGVFEILIEPKDGKVAIPHQSKVKVHTLIFESSLIA